MIGLLLGASILTLLILGPREKLTLVWKPWSVRYQADKPLTELATADLVALQSLLVKHEQNFPTLVVGAEKYIRFSAPSRPKRTPYVVLYLHGFSACRQEISPVPEQIAKALHANYHATRLTGHGLDKGALPLARPEDWLRDVMEAWQVARQLGDKAIILATSTGGTLAAWLAQQAEVQDSLHALLLISPNFQIYHWAAPTFTWPWSTKLLPRLNGPNHSWQPANDDEAKYWVYSYPISLVLKLAALVKAVRQSDISAIRAPTLFIYCDDDRIVNAKTTDSLMRRWGSAIKHRISAPPRADSNNHVITGDILCPDTTDQVVADCLSFVKRLQA